MNKCPSDDQLDAATAGDRLYGAVDALAEAVRVWRSLPSSTVHRDAVHTCWLEAEIAADCCDELAAAGKAGGNA
jgi:hypothetical protein